MGEEKFGEFLYRRRKELGLTQGEVADLARVARGTVAMAEKNLPGRTTALHVQEAIQRALSDAVVQERSVSAGERPQMAPKGRDAQAGTSRSVELGYSYPPAVHNAVKRLAVAAEIVLTDHIADLSGSHLDYDGNLVELLLDLTALPEDIRGRTAPELVELAEVMRRG